MEKKSIITIVLALVIISAIIFSGCGKQKPDSGHPQREEQREERDELPQETINTTTDICGESGENIACAEDGNCFNKTANPGYEGYLTPENCEGNRGACKCPEGTECLAEATDEPSEYPEWSCREISVDDGLVETGENESAE